MKPLFLIVLFFALVSALILGSTLYLASRRTQESAYASGAVLRPLPELLPNCAVYTLEKCGNALDAFRKQALRAEIEALLRQSGRTELARYTESVERRDPKGSDLLPPRLGVADMLLLVTEETGVSYQILVVLSAMVGTDPLRRPDATLTTPFGSLSEETGFYRQMRDIATRIAYSDANMIAEPIRIGSRRYLPVSEASEASDTLYRFLATTTDNPALFEAYTLKENSRRPNNIYAVWREFFDISLPTTK